MLRASHLPPVASPAFGVLRLALVPTLSFTSSSKLTTASFSPHLRTFLSKPNFPTSSNIPSLTPRLVPTMFGHPRPRGPGLSASLSTEANSGGEREILVQHLLVKEDDAKLLVELLQRVSSGEEDLSDLAVEYSICPSKQEGGMLGWVRKGQMVPEFEEAAFSAPLNKVVKCKTQFGWHLLQVLSEREEAVLVELPPEEFHVKMQDPEFMEQAQLIDVREPDEVATSSIPGFQVLPLRQFGSWAPEITTKFDPQKDTYVMCHHGMRSLQVAKWLQTQGFRKVYNLSGGIHAYAVKVDPSIPTY